MNDEQAKALGERLTACERWEWLEAMWAFGGAALPHPVGGWMETEGRVQPHVYMEDDKRHLHVGWAVGDSHCVVDAATAVPDMRDSATCGAVMGLLGDEAWRVGAVKSGGFCVAFDDESAPEGHRMTWVATWGEALVCVLEAT